MACLGCRVTVYLKGMGHGACARTSRSFSFFPCTIDRLRIILYFFPAVAVPLAKFYDLGWKVCMAWHHSGTLAYSLFCSLSADSLQVLRWRASTGSSARCIQLTKVSRYDNTMSCAIHLPKKSGGIRKQAVEHNQFHVDLSGIRGPGQTGKHGRSLSPTPLA
jgi:hypothetical protein